MSGHRTRPGFRPRRPAIVAATAAIILFAVGACTSTSTSGDAGAKAAAAAAVSTGPGGHEPTLTGAGSTFDAPFFSVAFTRYQQQYPGVTIGYSAVGSSAGIAAFSAGQVGDPLPSTSVRPNRRRPIRRLQLGGVRTDDLRITRGLLPRSHGVTCTDSTAGHARSADCTGISRLPVPRPVPRLRQARRLGLRALTQERWHQ